MKAWIIPNLLNSSTMKKQNMQSLSMASLPTTSPFYVTMIFANTDENGKMGYDCELNLGNTNRQIADLRYFADMLIDLQPEANTVQPATPTPETTEDQVKERTG
jgi:hypothetical protein